jgi:hypothetical protein
MNHLHVIISFDVTFYNIVLLTPLTITLLYNRLVQTKME